MGYELSRAAADSLEFTISPCSTAQTLAVDGDEASTLGLELSEERLEEAITWFFECDHQSLRAVMAGAPVSKPIPLNRMGMDRSAVNEEQARKERGSTGALLLPLLLAPPDLQPLFVYQREGVTWLMERKAALLADDMGLGKTVQVVYALAHLARGRRDPRFLVVCPRSLLANWQAEFTRWAPELHVVRLTPTAQTAPATWKAILGRSHVVITSYEQVREMPEIASQSQFGAVVADEAHRIRNAEARVTKGFSKLKTDAFWALTGTPIERDPEDLLTLLGLMDRRRFSRRDGALAPAQIRSRARPYLLRRLKSDVQSDLPPVVHDMQWLDLAAPQRESYRQAMASLKEHSGDQGRFLLLINKLREICDFDEATGTSSKLDRIVEIAQSVLANDEKMVVFSYLLKPLVLLQKRLRTELGSEAVCLFSGELSTDDRQRVLARFKQPAGPSVLLASSRVGGEGLTLTEANHVVFLNEWWNPSANAQARDRVMRIGQTRTVFVHQFRCKSTIEEALEGILREKSEMFDDIIDALVDDRKPRPVDGSVLTALKQKLQSL